MLIYSLTYFFVAAALDMQTVCNPIYMIVYNPSYSILHNAINSAQWCAIHASQRYDRWESW
jgi:hypothetical protein